jgi:hypothetical protein
MKFRSWIKKTTVGRLVWRIFIGIVGGGITVAGGIALIGPGPGILILLAGLGILASEFAWAGEVMMHTKRIAAKASEKTGLKPWVKYFIVSGGAVLSIVVILVYYRR